MRGTPSTKGRYIVERTSPEGIIHWVVILNLDRLIGMGPCGENLLKTSTALVGFISNFTTIISKLGKMVLVQRKPPELQKVQYVK